MREAIILPLRDSKERMQYLFRHHTVLYADILMLVSLPEIAIGKGAELFY